MENLKRQIEILKEERQKVSKRNWELYENQLNVLKSIAQEFFSNIAEDVKKINVGVDSIRFEMWRNEEKTSTIDYISIYFKNRDYSSLNFDCIETNNYSGGTLDHLITSGKIAKLIKDEGDVLLDKWNKAIKENPSKDKNLRSEWDISNEINKLRTQIEENKKKEILEKVKTEGIKFKNVEGKRLPSMDLKNGRELFDILSIKIVGETPSGKSVDIEGTYKGDVWNSEKSLHEKKELEYRFEKIRKVNVEALLTYYRDRISVS